MANKTVNVLQADIDAVNVGEAHHIDAPEQCRDLLNYKNSDISIVCQNIRSVNHNLDDFSLLLDRLNVSADFLVLTECWLPKTKKLPTMENYHTYSTKRNTNQNDGVLVFLK